ncbi:hypothetical protein BDV36DRAFT_309317 [Aspergillus pseudocaelatus]|uniref:F-box domain-containing protein n=1 Tax=Aspergillus pseudocaelatus TaxID=1825620 RepID=A0ABQ6X4F0_9EURO|nr:hypothetical protein BDV36DRAFT_309317 [Aspergillus pseudocaelatus]
MVGLLSLPTEFVDRIFALIDLQTRKALRLANPRLSIIGQRWIFHTTVVSPTEASCDRFDRILESSRLASYVRKIYLNTWDLGNDNIEEQYFEHEDHEEDTGLHPRFWDVFDRLKDFPRLQSVVLRFHQECDEDDKYDAPQSSEFRFAVMARMMAVLKSLPRPLHELGLRDIYNVNVTNKETVANLQNVLGSLRSLRLNIANVNRGLSGSSDYHRNPPQNFHSELPLFWLKPTMSNLEHLTLYSSLYFGFYPVCDLRDIRFPRLKTLSLGNHTFIHDSQLEWILSHGSTLTELYMDDCVIIWAASIYHRCGPTLLPREEFHMHPDLPDQLYTTYDKRWVDYFRAFEKGLPNLRQFHFGHSPYWGEEDTTPFEHECEIRIGFHEECYLVFCDGFLPSEYMQQMTWRKDEEGGGRKYVKGEGIKPSTEDRQALIDLCAKVGQTVTLHEEDFLPRY